MKVVESLREQIIALGGEIRFEQRVTDIVLGQSLSKSGALLGAISIRALEVENLEQWQSCTSCRQAMWSWHLGHSSRDTFAMLYERGVAMQVQAVFGRLPDRAPAKRDRPRALGPPCGAPAAWARRTTSWCTTRPMAGRYTASACARVARWWRPPANPERVVTNGMSQYSRAERNANAGMVVGIDLPDYPDERSRFCACVWPRGERQALRGRRPPP